jgi:hypothetical protein
MKSLCDHFHRRECFPKRGQLTRACGQSGVEFALVATVAMIVLFVGVQFAMIGRAALALGQMTYQGARYASVHRDCYISSCDTTGQLTIRNFMLGVGSPTFNNDADKLVIEMVTPAEGTARTFGEPVTIKSTFTLPPSVQVLPNPFLGIPFPSTLTSSETAMSE